VGSEEVGPGTGRALRRWVNPGLFEDLPDGGGGEVDPEDEELAVETAVAPARILGGDGFGGETTRLCGEWSLLANPCGCSLKIGSVARRAWLR
jgi:hypothetical protein